MAVESSMLALGTQVPDFNLNEVVSGKTISFDTFKDKKALLVIFICRHCPYVKHVQSEIVRIAKDYQVKGLGVVAISSNDPEAYPEDAPESLKEQAQELGFTFPYLYDETQEVAKAYSARCTPDSFLFNKARGLVYRGQLDDARPGNNLPVTGKDIRAATEAVLNDQPVSQDQVPSTGCSIKWKPGNQP